MQLCVHVQWDERNGSLSSVFAAVGDSRDGAGNLTTANWTLRRRWRRAAQSFTGTYSIGAAIGCDDPEFFPAARRSWLSHAANGNAQFH